MKWTLLSKYRGELMGVAMLWVMLFHAWALDFPWLPLNGLRAIGFGGVDIFILLSAMGLTCSLVKKSVGYWPYLKRRLLRVLPAFYLVVTLYALWQWRVGDIPLSTVGWDLSLLYYWKNVPGAFNWYIPAILIFYAAAPACVALVRRVRHPLPFLALTSAIGIAACRYVMWRNCWCYLDFFYRVPIFWVGIVVGLAVLSGKELTRRQCAGLVLSFLVGCAIIGGYYAGYTDLRIPYGFLFLVPPLCLGLGWVFERLRPNGIRRFFRLVGANSLEIYLLNVSVFSQFDRLHRYFDPGPGHYLYYLAAFALNIALGCGLHWLLGKAGQGLAALRGNSARAGG